MDQRNAAKKQGDELFIVGAGNGLRAKLSVSERDIQYVKPGQHGELAATVVADGKISVHDRAGRSAWAKPRKATTRSRFTGIWTSTSPDWRPGVEGEARVDIERRPLVWIWTHRFFDYLKFKLWM